MKLEVWELELSDEVEVGVSVANLEVSDIESELEAEEVTCSLMRHRVSKLANTT